MLAFLTVFFSVTPPLALTFLAPVSAKAGRKRMAWTLSFSASPGQHVVKLLALTSLWAHMGLLRQLAWAPNLLMTIYVVSSQSFFHSNHFSIMFPSYVEIDIEKEQMGL